MSNEFFKENYIYFRGKKYNKRVRGKYICAKGQWAPASIDPQAIISFKPNFDVSISPTPRPSVPLTAIEIEVGHVTVNINTNYKGKVYNIEFNKVENRFYDEVKHRQWKV